MVNKKLKFEHFALKTAAQLLPFINDCCNS